MDISKSVAGHTFLIGANSLSHHHGVTNNRIRHNNFNFIVPKA